MEQFCSANASGCTIETVIYDQGFTSAGCYITQPPTPPPSVCPAGQIYCGGCISACRSNSQSCTAWINQECTTDPGGGGGGGGTVSCTWCTRDYECAAAGGSWEGSGSSWCTAPDGGCCITQGGGGGGCTPSCSGNLCGQSNGCGGTCSNSDDGSPAAPTITSPTAGSQVYPTFNGSTYSVTVDWNDPTKAQAYQIEIYPLSTGCGATTDSFCGNVSASTYTLSGIQSQVYQVRVRAINSRCGTDYSTWTPFTYFAVVGDITGTVYIDNAGTASLTGGVCTTGAALPTTSAGNALINVFQNGSWIDTSSVQANGTYSLTTRFWNPGNNVVRLFPGAGDYECLCPAGCSYSGIDTPQSGVNFFVVQTRDPWFQAQGGPIMALQETGNAIRNYIPDTCLSGGGCTPRLIRRSAEAWTSGYVLTGGGTVDLRSDPGNQANIVDVDARNMVATIDRQESQENYEYFWRRFNFPENPVSDFGATAGDAQRPTGYAANAGSKAFYHNGDLTIQDPWTIPAGLRFIIFVDGDVTIANTIQTPVTGYLAIIASGDIIIDPSLGYSTLDENQAGLIDGVFIANGQIRLPSRGTAAGGDLMFIGEGTFVGWGGVSLERDYDDGGARKAQNNTNPTEIFRYRPDFMYYTPIEMREPKYSWREVAP